MRDEDRETLTGCIDRFRAGIAELQADAAFDLAEAAFVIGIYAPRTTVTEFRREQVKAANDARRANNVQEVIDLHAGRRKGSKRGIARKIRQDVNRDILEIKNVVPPRWIPVNYKDDPDSAKKEIEKQIRRIASRL